MRQLSDILIEKKDNVGSFAEIGRLLGNLTGQQIGQYASGKIVPALDFAINWKKAFNENLIDLMFSDEQPTIAAEPEVKYSLASELIETQRSLIRCQMEKEKMQQELNELKNFNRDTERKPKLKK
jgi:hypothetical protein